MIEMVFASAIRSTFLIGAVWIGLKALRVASPHILMSAWRLTLLACLLTPLFIDRPLFTMQSAALPIPSFLSVEPLAPAGPTPNSALTSATAQLPRDVAAPLFDWSNLADSIYLFGAGWLLLRLLIGSALTWRVCRSAAPIREEWTKGKDVRASALVKTPGTFGSTILVPEDYESWDLVERRAVIAHEDAHVRRGDFHVLLLASINRAVFWFNPLAWWLYGEIAYLAEARSDLAAIEDIGDRLRYAEILIALGRGPSGSIGLAMARPETVGRRVERILAENVLPRKMDRKVWAAIVACILPLAAVASGAVAQAPTQSTPAKEAEDEAAARAQRLAEQATPRTEIKIDPKILDNYVGYYRLGPNAVLTITRQEDRLFAQLTGQGSAEVYPESATKFFYKVVAAQLSFATDAQGRATELTLHQNGAERHAKRIDKAEMQRMQDQLAERIKSAKPMPGSEEALRRFIETLSQGEPDYSVMTDQLAKVTREQLPDIQRGLTTLGPMQSISFRGVGMSGWDIFELKFTNGTVITRINMGPDGKIAGSLIQPGP